MKKIKKYWKKYFQIFFIFLEKFQYYLAENINKNVKSDKKWKKLKFRL